MYSNISLKLAVFTIKTQSPVKFFATASNNALFDSSTAIPLFANCIFLSKILYISLMYCFPNIVFKSTSTLSAPNTLVVLFIFTYLVI